MDKKQALKTAAYEVFSKKGYKATGISEIARQAGVAVGSFYNYYESKEAIFLDIYIDENNRVRQAMIEELDWEIDMIDLVKTFTNRMQAEGYSPEKIQEILQVYNLFYYMDMHITEKDFPDIGKTVEILATNFIKGVLK